MRSSFVPLLSSVKLCFTIYCFPPTRLNHCTVISIASSSLLLEFRVFGGGNNANLPSKQRLFGHMISTIDLLMLYK
ncbi:hypothetical protein F511_11847 [Dorcoceras hygrometricum]|uniref:Uncharacterized protein n=1 Tax=Dorcoceras hygrometricum TaxID=472368 RepID=A0A2Z7B9D4_9LAMI|nr:hypothetical protein F511_11847 [Dorcoceras hygrometricum]